jgi:hypothetical protein
MPGLDIQLNSQGYILKPSEEGVKIVTRPVQQFVTPIRQTGRTRPEDVAPYESFIIPNLQNGFGRERIASDSAFNPEEYRHFWNSTCETRFADAIYLPILSNAGSSTGLERIRCSAEFKGTLFTLWEADAGGAVVCAKFDSDGTPKWVEAGEIININGVVGTASSVITDTSVATGTSGDTRTISHDVSGDDTLLLVFVGNYDTDSTRQYATDVQYAGADMTGDAHYAIAGNAGTGNMVCSLWYKDAPAAGTNNVVVTYNTAGTDRDSVIVVSLQNVADSSILSSAVTSYNDSVATSNSITVTSVVGQIVFDGIMLSTGSTTVGALQTGLPATTQMRVSAEYASSTSTAMSHTFSSAAYAHVGVGVTFKGGVGALDMIATGSYLIALVTFIDGIHAYRSTDGATWTVSNTNEIGSGLLANSVQAGEDIDAGLLAEIGGEIVAVVWDEDNGQIIFYSSTDDGNNYSRENDAGSAAVSIHSTSGVKGLAVMVGVDGEDKLYVGAPDGLYEVDTAPTNWTVQLIDKLPQSSHNCRRMVVHQGSLWYPIGVDNSTPAGMRKLTNSNRARQIDTNLGLAFGDGVESDMLGPIRWMQSAGEYMFATVGGGAASRNARVICWNGKGWHHMARFVTAEKEIQWMHISNLDDGAEGTPMLHYNVKTATSASSMFYQNYPLTNPNAGVTITREDHTDGQAGQIELPYYDMGIPQENKNFLAAHVIADGLDSTASSSTTHITIDYGTGSDARSTTDLGDILSGTSKLTFGSDAGISAKNVGLRLNLHRDGTASSTPKLKDVVIEGYVVPGVAYEHQMTIDIEATARAVGLSSDTVISNLKTMVSTVTQVAFDYGSESSKVAVDRERSQFLYNTKEWGPSGAPNSLAQKTGEFRLVLVEKTAT